MSSERCPDSLTEFQQHPNCYSLYPISPDDEHHRSISACSQTDRPRRSRQGSDLQLNNRRSSVHSGQSRTRANSRVTPLGDGRRASICKRGGKVRRSSTAHRKDSVRPSRAEIKVPPIELKTPEEIQQARRHRRIAMIVVGTFVFLLAASVLAVVVTLTHSSFYIPPLAPDELNKLRDHEMRKENEALMNSLNRDSSVPANSTASP